MIRKNRAQSFSEYAVLIGVVVAALIGMHIYLGRIVQGKFRQAGDVFGGGEQYEIGLTQVTDDSINPNPIPSPAPTDNPCPFVLSQIDKLNQEVASLTQRANDLAGRIQDIRQQIQVLRDAGLTDQVNQLLEAVQTLQEQENQTRQELQEKQDQINAYRNDFPQC